MNVASLFGTWKHARVWACLVVMSLMLIGGGVKVVERLMTREPREVVLCNAATGRIFSHFPIHRARVIHVPTQLGYLWCYDSDSDLRPRPLNLLQRLMFDHEEAVEAQLILQLRGKVKWVTPRIHIDNEDVKLGISGFDNS